jgi:hypothetical protein
MMEEGQDRVRALNGSGALEEGAAPRLRFYPGEF